MVKCNNQTCPKKNVKSNCLVSKNEKKAKHDASRMNRLASPKWVTRPYEPPIYDPMEPLLEIRSPPATPRIKELALPHVRCLVSAGEQYEAILEDRRKDILRAQMKQSVLTLYSRLAHIQLVERK